MSRYISMTPKKRKNMGWDFFFKAFRLISVSVLFFGSVDLAAKEDPLAPFNNLEDVVVAVIDTGADINHELLQGKFWVNPGEIPNNGIDDDKNGYIDDVNGWNFVGNNNRVQDSLGHGTHISGIIAGRKDSNSSFHGIAPNAKIMVLKYFDPNTSGLDNLRFSIQAMQYAIRMKARIINYSGGGMEFSAEEKSVMMQAERQGILVVAAAGNEKSDTDQKPFYPANYRLRNIMSVAAVDQNSLLLPSSNFGKVSVSLAAPGFRIRSTIPDNKLGVMTGTSQSTAFVTGTAALLMGEGRRPLSQLISLITSAVETRSSLSKMVSSKGELNIEKTLSMKSPYQSAMGRVTEPAELPDNSVFLWKVSDTLL